MEITKMLMKITIPCNNSSTFCVDIVILNTPEPLHLQCRASRHPVHYGYAPKKKDWELGERLGKLTVAVTWVLFGLVIWLCCRVLTINTQFGAALEYAWTTRISLMTSTAEALSNKLKITQPAMCESELLLQPRPFLVRENKVLSQGSESRSATGE